MRAGGPGGQHVNTAETAVRLRFDLMGSRVLHDAVKRRIRGAVPSQVTEGGELLITASRHRSQSMNLDDARQRLADLIAQHLRAPPRRRKTRPTRASQRRRVDAKKKRGQKKQLRQKPRRDD